MRRVVFRGKDRETGDWIQGLPFEHSRDGWYFNHGFHNPSAVIDSTIGQFTGMTDRNGKKIFEGDIVKTQPIYDKPYAKNRTSKQFIGVVAWEEFKFHNESSDCSGQVYGAKFSVKLPDTGKYQFYSWNLFYGCEVVGNIHDNPELIEKELQCSITDP